MAFVSSTIAVQAQEAERIVKEATRRLSEARSFSTEIEQSSGPYRSLFISRHKGVSLSVLSDSDSVKVCDGRTETIQNLKSKTWYRQETSRVGRTAVYGLFSAFVPHWEMKTCFSEFGIIQEGGERLAAAYQFQSASSYVRCLYRVSDSMPYGYDIFSGGSVSQRVRFKGVEIDAKAAPARFAFVPGPEWKEVACATPELLAIGGAQPSISFSSEHESFKFILGLRTRKAIVFFNGNDNDSIKYAKRIAALATDPKNDLRVAVVCRTQGELKRLGRLNENTIGVADSSLGADSIHTAFKVRYSPTTYLIGANGNIEFAQVSTSTHLLSARLSGR